MKRLLRGKDGFTLVEAMISIALLTILLLAFTLMVATSSRMNTASQQRQEQLERVLDAVYLEGTQGVSTSGEAPVVTITVGDTTYNPTAQTVVSEEGDVRLTWFE